MQQPILIVGAGPTGLTLAIELARREVPYRIIDKLPFATQQSRALGIHARTLEVFSDMGVLDAVLQRGNKMQTLTIHAKHKVIAQLHYERVVSPYPFVIILAQAETEAVLANRLRELGGVVERDCELINFSETVDGVRATLRHAHGRTETMETSYLIGCDGAHSTVRHQLNLSFSGDATDESWILADVQMRHELSDQTFGIFLDAQGLFLLAPFGQNQYRLAASHRAAGVDDASEPTLEEFKALVDTYLPNKVHLESASWLSKFRIHYRHVDTYQQGRIFLAGDAGHIHSPAGGQGMNTGIQDAYNLAWKLALVYQRQARPSLLASYSEERVPVAKQVLKQSKMLTRLFTIQNPIFRTLRNGFMPWLTQLNVVQDTVLKEMSEIGIHYSPSSVITEYWQGPSAIKSGYRAPTIDICHGTKHVLLVFLFMETEGVLTYIKQRYADLIDIRMASHDVRLREIYAVNSDCLWLIRPDGYIAYRSQPAEVNRLLQFLNEYFCFLD